MSGAVLFQDCFDYLGSFVFIYKSGEGNDRGWDGWMASLTQWTWVSVNSESWWWTGRPDVLWFMGSQTVRHDWETEQNWTDTSLIIICSSYMKNAIVILIGAYSETLDWFEDMVLYNNISSSNPWNIVYIFIYLCFLSLISISYFWSIGLLPP